MALRALLTLDIDRDASSEKRKKFYDWLKDKSWTKIPKLTTTWKARFEDGVSQADALKEAKNDVKGAADHSGVSTYDAAGK
jgi:hypothetical protein